MQVICSPMNIGEFFADIVNLRWFTNVLIRSLVICDGSTDGSTELGINDNKTRTVRRINMTLIYFQIEQLPLESNQSAWGHLNPINLQLFYNNSPKTSLIES